MTRVGQLYREKIVNHIKSGVTDNESVFVLKYSSLNCMKINELRMDLRKAGASVYVSKNRLLKYALKTIEKEALAEDLTGQTALVWSSGDSAAVSKILVEFSKDLENVSVHRGLLDGRIIEKGDIKRLSELPSREVLLSQLLGTIQAPVSNLMGALNAKSRDLLSILKQLSEKRGIVKMSEDTATEKKESVELSKKLEDVAKTIEGLTALELSELVKGLEDRLGITAAAPMAAGMVMAAGGGAGAGEAAEEKTEFDVILAEAGAQKIAVIKEVRAATNLGLKEAKDLVEAAPKPVKEGISKDEAEELKKKLEAAGAKIEIK